MEKQNERQQKPEQYRWLEDAMKVILTVPKGEVQKVKKKVKATGDCDEQRRISL